MRCRGRVEGVMPGGADGVVLEKELPQGGMAAEAPGERLDGTVADGIVLTAARGRTGSVVS